MSTSLRHVGLVAVGGSGWMGGANYIRNLAAAIQVADPAVKISFVCGDALLPDWRDVAPRVTVSTRPSLIRDLFSGARPLGRALKTAGIEFTYPLTYDNEYNLGAPFPLSTQLNGHPWAGWIPDFQHRYLPELFSAEEIARRDRNIASLVEEAPRIVLSSESAERDLQRFHPEQGAKSEVLRFAVPPIRIAENATPPADVPERFFLVCNQFWKHKNHLVVFAALRLLQSRGIRPIVLCTGKMDDYRDASYAGEIKAALGDLSDQVKILGLVPREQQVELMRRALAIVQPSLFEGWSTVIEDARGLGRPTILSDLEVHREQAPPGARYFDPRNPEALADLLAVDWEQAKPGPDLAAEAAARKDAEARLIAVGRRFLEIAARVRT